MRPAIGNPFELKSAVSVGITIGSKRRTVEKIKLGKMLQADVAINSGDSGGSLIDLRGYVVGINTEIASSSGGYEWSGLLFQSNMRKG